MGDYLRRHSTVERNAPSQVAVLTRDSELNQAPIGRVRQGVSHAHSNQSRQTLR